MSGLTRGTVRWDEGRNNLSAAPSPWGNSVVSSSAPTADGGDADGEGDGDRDGVGAASKKKGGKGKKQTLYRFG